MVRGLTTHEILPPRLKMCGPETEPQRFEAPSAPHAQTGQKTVPAATTSLGLALSSPPNVAKLDQSPAVIIENRFVLWAMKSKHNQCFLCSPPIPSFPPPGGKACALGRAAGPERWRLKAAPCWDTQYQPSLPSGRQRFDYFGMRQHVTLNCGRVLVT